MIPYNPTFFAQRPLVSHIVDALNKRILHMHTELDDLEYRHGQAMQGLSELILVRSAILSQHFNHYNILDDSRRVSEFAQKQILRLPRYLQIAADLSQQADQPIATPEMHAQRMANWHITLMRRLEDKKAELKLLDAEITSARTRLIPGMLETSLLGAGTAKIMESLDYSVLRQEYNNAILELELRLQEMRLALAERIGKSCAGGLAGFNRGIVTALQLSGDLLAQMRQHLEYFGANIDRYGSRIRKYLALSEQLHKLSADK